MEQPQPHELAKAILTSPGWVRVGLTAPREQLREAAAQELAKQICRVIDGEDIEDDPRQTALPFDVASDPRR